MEKPTYLVKLEELLEKPTLTCEDKAFLRARKADIDPKQFKLLDLDSCDVEEVESDEEILEKMSLKEVKEVAKINGIDLGKAKTKKEILKVLQEATK